MIIDDKTKIKHLESEIKTKVEAIHRLLQENENLANQLARKQENSTRRYDKNKTLIKELDTVVYEANEYIVKYCFEEACFKLRGKHRYLEPVYFQDFDDIEIEVLSK